MEKITTVIDGKSSREFVKPTFTLDYVALGVGAFCILLYIFFGIKDGNWLTGLSLILVVVGLLLVILAIVLLVKLNSALKKADEFKRTITYDFQDEYFVYEVKRDEEVIENGKLLYTDLTEYKETEHYVYVGLKNNTWFAVDKVEGLVSFLANKGLNKFKLVKAVKK